MSIVWVLGSLNIDLVARVERFPQPGETLTGQALVRRPGGKGANQAVAAAAAGARVRMIGRVGDDAEGRDYLLGLAERAVDVSRVVVEPGASTGHAVILVDDRAENCIVAVPGANGLVDASDVERLDPRPRDVVLLQLEVPVEAVRAAVTAAHAARAQIILNVSPYQDLDPALLLACDVVVVNEQEARALDAAGIELPSVVVTRGSAGATWNGESARCAADLVVDTTGAGDAFAGALAAALADGRDRPVALTLAVTAGARAVGVDGAQGWSF